MAVKRRVYNEICDRELLKVERSTEGIIEDGLGAAHRLLESIGCDGNAHYSVRVLKIKTYK